MKTKSEYTQLISTRLPKGDFERLKKQARAEGMTMAGYVRRLLICEYNKDMEKKRGTE